MPAGRPKGAINKKSRALIDLAEQRGVTPLEVMLDNMRTAYANAKLAESEIPILNPDLLSTDAMAAFKTILHAVQRVVGFRQIAQECAAEAAPFIHAKLSAIQHSGEITTSKVIRAPSLAPTAETWAAEHAPKHTEH